MSLLNLACMGLSGALMAAAVLAVRAVALHRLPKQAFVVLWALVALRLLVPVWVPSPLSAFGPVQERVTAFAEEYASLGATSRLAAGEADGTRLTAGENAGSGMTEIADGTSGAHAKPSDAAESTGADGTAAPTADSAAVDGRASAAGRAGTTGQADGASAAATPSPTPATPTSGNAGPALSPAAVVACIWALGTVGFTAFFATVYLRARRDFRTSLPVADPRARTWLAAHLPNPRVSVRVSDRVGTPLTYGIARPVVLMPASTDWADTERLAFVLDHELAHMRRHDALLKPLLAAAVCLHWWNPLAWAMFALANRDIELACDEAVLRAYPRDRRAAYAHALVSLEEHRDLPALVCTAFGRTAIEERIGAIMRAPHRSIAALAASGLLVVGIPAALATAAVQPAVPADPAGPVQPVVGAPVADVELAAPIAAYTDEEWQRVSGFLRETLAPVRTAPSHMTVERFRAAALAEFSGAEDRDLLARLAADSDLRARAAAWLPPLAPTLGSDLSDDALIGLVYYALLPLTSDTWQTTTSAGCIHVPLPDGGTASLDYTVTAAIDDPASALAWHLAYALLQAEHAMTAVPDEAPAEDFTYPAAGLEAFLRNEATANALMAQNSVSVTVDYTYRLPGSDETYPGTASYGLSAQSLATQRQLTADLTADYLVAVYEELGLACAPVQRGDYLPPCYAFTYQEQPVARIYDPLYDVDALYFANSDPSFALEQLPADALNLAAVYEGGALVALRDATSDEVAAMEERWPNRYIADDEAAGYAIPETGAAYTEEELRLITGIYDQVKNDENLTLEGFADLLASIGYLDNPATVDLRDRLSADQAAFGEIADNELASFIHSTLVPLSYPGSPAHFQARVQRAVDLPDTDGVATATLDYTLSASPANDPSAATVSEWTAIVAGALAAVADALGQAPADYLSDAELMRYAFGGLVAERMPTYNPGINLVLSGQYSYTGQDGTIVGSSLVPYTLSGSSSPAYPVNENGQTYGSEADALSFAPNGAFSLDSLPDLVSVVGIDGRAGYVYKEELHTPTPADPEEALAMMESGALGPREIDVYAVDGEMVIDTSIVDGSSAAPASQTED